MKQAPTLLHELVGREADETAVADDNRSQSWAELDSRTHLLIRGLEALGVGYREHVAIAVTNRIEFLESYIATLRGGFTQTPVKTNWKPAEMSYLLADASSKAVITDVDSARQAAADAGIAVVDLDDDFSGWLDSQDPTPVEAGRKGYRIPYTSGTTGAPKGVERTLDTGSTFEEWARSNALGAQGIGLPRDGLHLMVSQMFHGAPMTFGFGALCRGAPMRIVSRWDASRFADLLAEGITATIMVPTMFRHLLALPEEQRQALDTALAASHLGYVLHGGEACPVELKRKMIHWWGPIFTEYYGFTEGGMTLADSHQWLERPGTVGLPIGELKVHIVDENGNDLGPRQEGEIYFTRPEGRYFRYLKEDEKTERAYRADNSFTVGDIGYLDDDGYLFVSGRTAELIVAAGVNIYPAEIEAVLFEIPGVADACVAGGPDPERGEQPVAFVVVADDCDPDEVVASVESICEAEIAGYKRPRKIVVRDEIPRDPTGKTLRVVLRNELWEKAGS